MQTYALSKLKTLCVKQNEGSDYKSYKTGKESMSQRYSGIINAIAASERRTGEWRGGIFANTPSPAYSGKPAGIPALLRGLQDATCDTGR